ncbi:MULTISPECIES: hypothetical protein [unclassified Novosphingobium]|uniref:hypothetical protein n=1 Tax=unclassified Novosphingobium TaxID=2644732 RepID=UPI0008694018|nr:MULTISPECIES: hypothetical protein [unclassified Novosphingobium]MBN9146524.1 hypothetical protein [Novosphingobium sp.]ODU78118.1 MAG: hypothetical protein ABT10_23355 [Novosphingobium sp. SCN 63-17]OJX91038.1 MAG: hypothetical protein BGP00_07420 [Novosphingobium sp. 63-713]
MAKITNLDQLIAANVDGSETLPVVKGAKSWRVRLSDLFSPLTAMINAMAPAAAQGAMAASSLAAWVDSGAAVTTGYSINADGQAVAVAGYQYLDYVPTGADTAFAATGTENGNGTQLALYLSASGAVLGRQFVGTGASVAYVDQPLTLPAGTAKIRLCGVTAGGATLSLKVNRVTTGIASAVAANTGAIAANAVTAALGKAAASSLGAWADCGVAPVAGSYVSATGALVANAAYQYLDYTLTGAEVALRATGTENGAATQLALYLSASGAVLGREFVGTGSAVAYANQALTVPSGTAKVRLSGATSSGAALALQIKTVVTDLAGTVAANSAGLVSQSALAATLASSLASWADSGVAVVTGSYISASGAAVAAAGFQYLDYVVTAADTGFKANATVTGTATQLAVYLNASGAVIGLQGAGTASATVYADQALALPAGTAKIRLCGSTSGGAALSLSVNRVASSMAAQVAANATGVANAIAAAAAGQSAADSLSAWADSGGAVVNGYFIDSAGAAQASSFYKYLDYTVTGSEIGFRATGTENGNATQLALYLSAGGAVLGREFVGTGTNVAYANQTLTVPSGTAKIRLCSITSGNPALALQVKTMATGIPAALAAAQAASASGQQAASALSVWQTAAVAPTTGYYINNLGVATALSGYQYLDYTLAGGELAFRASGSESGNATQLALYLNASGTVLGREFVGSGSTVAYVNQVLTLPAGTAKIRLCGITSGGATLSLQIQTMLSNAGQRILDLAANGSGARNITVVGDSTSAQLAPYLAALYPGRTTYAQGLGGQTTQQVAARLGAAQVTLAAFTLPTSGSVAVVPSVDLLSIANRTVAVSCRVMVLGIPCNLVCAASTGAYTLTPTAYPASALTIPAGTPITVISGVSQSTDPSAAPSLDTMLAGNVVLRTSRNDTTLLTSGAGMTSVLGWMGSIAAQVAARGGRLLLCTCINGNYDMPSASGLAGANSASDAVADARLAAIASLNAQMLANWPDKVIDVLGNHILRGGGAARTVNGNTYTVLDQPTMRSDGLHETDATGLPLTAAFVQAYINGRGW